MKILWSHEGSDADSATKPNAYWQCKQIFCSFATSREGPLQESCFVEVFGASNGIHGLKWSSLWICECPDYQFAACPKQFGAHSQKCKYNMPPPNPRMGKEREHDSLHTDSRLYLPESSILDVFWSKQHQPWLQEIFFTSGHGAAVVLQARSLQ